jgi:serine/threonine protein kinase
MKNLHLRENALASMMNHNQVEESVFPFAENPIVDSEKTAPIFDRGLVFLKSKLWLSALSTFRFFGLFGYICVLSPFLHSSSSDDVAFARANVIWKKDRNIGLTYKQLVSACRFIEKIDSAGGDTMQQVFPSKITQLPCLIEGFPPLRGYLIRNLPGKSCTIGRGVHKVVTKAIFYGKKPRIIADCSSDDSGAEEIAVLNKLGKCPGIVSFLGAVTRSQNSYSIYLEYYSEGSLRKKVKQGYTFSTNQMLKIAKDVVRGLNEMHSRHFVHRDLHTGNILLHLTSSGLFDAALVDFGKTINIQNAGNRSVPQAAKNRNPPEALLMPFSSLNRYLVDVYAMGCNFYYMMWGHSTPWEWKYNVYSLDALSPQFRKKMHKQMVSKYKWLKYKKIGALLKKKWRGESLSKKDEFQILIFQMMDPEPHRRPDTESLLKRLHRL